MEIEYYRYLEDYLKRMNETISDFSPINLRTIGNTDAYRYYKDSQTAVNIDNLVNQIGGEPSLYSGSILSNKFVNVVSDKNFDMFNYVEYLKQDPAYQKFTEEHKNMGMSDGQIVFLYTIEHDKKIIKSLESTKKNSRNLNLNVLSRVWANKRKEDEALEKLDDNSDFKRYTSEFSSTLFPAERYILEEFKKGDSYYSVSYRSIVPDWGGCGGGIPEECGPFLQEGALVIFDGSERHGSDISVTFYTPEGKLLGGYKRVNMKDEIINPKTEQALSESQQKTTETVKEKDMFLEGTGISKLSPVERKELFDKSNQLRREHPIMQEVSLTTMCRCYTAESDNETKLGFLKTLYQIRKGGETRQEKNEMADTFARVLDKTPELKKDEYLVALSKRDTVVSQPTRQVRRQVESVDR